MGQVREAPGQLRQLLFSCPVRVCEGWTICMRLYRGSETLSSHSRDRLRSEQGLWPCSGLLVTTLNADGGDGAQPPRKRCEVPHGCLASLCSVRIGRSSEELHRSHRLGADQFGWSFARKGRRLCSVTEEFLRFRDAYRRIFDKRGSRTRFIVARANSWFSPRVSARQRITGGGSH